MARSPFLERVRRTLRARHLSLRTEQRLLGHKKSIETTMIYTHVTGKGVGARSPLDELA